MLRDPFPRISHGECHSRNADEILQRYDILQGNFSVPVTDNGANFVAALLYAPVVCHSCIAHLSDLVALQVLGNTRMAPILKNPRSLVGYFKHSPAATMELKTIYSICGPTSITYKTLKEDVDTCWSSTYSSSCVSLVRLSKALQAMYKSQQ